MLERFRLQVTNRPVEVLKYWYADKDNAMLLSPPYQRGDVWGVVRRLNLIKSLIIGIPIPPIIVNDRFSAGWDSPSCVVIDGKQRITSILLFMLDKMTVPADWFDGKVGDYTLYSELSLPDQRKFKNHTLGFCEGQLGTIEEEKEVFDLINFGGVAQGESDPPEMMRCDFHGCYHGVVDHASSNASSKDNCPKCRGTGQIIKEDPFL